MIFQAPVELSIIIEAENLKRYTPVLDIYGTYNSSSNFSSKFSIKIETFEFKEAVTPQKLRISVSYPFHYPCRFEIDVESGKNKHLVIQLQLSNDNNKNEKDNNCILVVDNSRCRRIKDTK